MTPAQFKKQMDKYGKNVVRNVDALVQRCAIAVDSTVVLATPVDTGRARSNWQVEFDKPAEGTIETLAGVNKGHKGSGTAVANASMEKARAKIVQYNGDNHKEINITNNLHYIGRLNEGYSAQAPAGFVEQAVIVGVNTIKGAKILVDRTIKP